MSWVPTKMRFSGTCVECGKTIHVNESGLWARGVGVRHEECRPAEGLTCIVCGGPAGCGKCEFQDDCDIKAVSGLCICRRCSELPDPLAAYRDAAAKKFPQLES